MECPKDEVHTAFENPDNQDHLAAENDAYQMSDAIENQAGEDTNGWDSGSQYLLDSQQLVEAMSLCDEFLHSQSPNRNGVEGRKIENKPRLSDYAHLGPENFKRDLEECQALILDPSNIEEDTPPDFRLSQLVSSIISMPYCFPCIDLTQFFSYLVFHNSVVWFFFFRFLFAVVFDLLYFF